MNDERIRFRVRTIDDAFACDVRAKWLQLEENMAVLEVELRRHDGAAIEITSALVDVSPWAHPVPTVSQ